MMITDIVLTARYQVKELLSQKAGRQTVLATDLQTQEPVIIKMLRFGDAFEWDDLKLFEREAATLKNLDHPGIPRYLDYFEVDEVDNASFALVQSYIEAPSIEDLIRRGWKFSETEIIELADRLLDLLNYLHQQCPPVIHRDVKPSNILLKNRSGNSIGEVYLVDFGSVQTAAKKEEGTITIVGSYGYIPLEQFGGHTTTASDLYGLGMTLIYLLTGTHPAELTQVDGRVKFTAQISRQFERWLLKMIQPHLDKRFDSAKAAQQALNSEDGSYGDFDRLKPSDTQIRLYRDRSRLQIIYDELVPLIPKEIFAGVLCCSFIMMILSVLAGFSFAFVYFLALFGSLSALSGLPKRKIHCSLMIDEHCISKHRGSKKRRMSFKEFDHSRSQIGILAYNPGYQFDKCLDSQDRLIRGNTITIPPKLYFYCGNREYSFPTHYSQAELWWLGKELSDFLNIELQVIYPIPKVPPEPSCGGGC